MNTSGSSLDALDLTDLMLLQHPEMWGNDYPNAYYDIKSYGAVAPAEKKTYFLCFDCKEMTTLVKNECCDGCWKKLMKYKASLKKLQQKRNFAISITVRPKKCACVKQVYPTLNR